MNRRVFWADSRGKTIVVLFVLLVASLLFQFRIAFVWHVLISLVLSVSIDVFFLWIRSKKWVISLSAIITGLLIGLVFDPLSGYLPIAIACLFASISKNFIGKDPHKHVFNPAAFGIIVSSFIFSRPVAWWGASWGVIPVLIIGVGMLPILWKIHRHWMSLTFLIVYFITNLFHGSVDGAFRLTIDGTVFLFAFIMLPEPKTALLQGKWLWGWGILVGFFVLIQNLLGIAIADPLLLALLGANLVKYFFVRR